MSTDDAADAQDHLPLDDMADPAGEPTDPAGHAFDSLWGSDFADADPLAANLFSAEIENVNASDWNLDSDLIWGGGDGDHAVDDGGGGSIGLDFPL
jgi:hypothetical protein